MFTLTFVFVTWEVISARSKDVCNAEQSARKTEFWNKISQHRDKLKWQSNGYEIWVKCEEDRRKLCSRRNNENKDENLWTLMKAHIQWNWDLVRLLIFIQPKKGFNCCRGFQRQRTVILKFPSMTSTMYEIPERRICDTFASTRGMTKGEQNVI